MRPRENPLEPKLTAQLIRSTPAPATRSITLWDRGPKRVAGFGARVYAGTKLNPGGVRSFFLNYRVGGVERRYRIGRFPIWSVEAAREEARELRKRVDRGEDPATDKRARQQAPTIAHLIARYERDHLPSITESERSDHHTILGEIGKHLGLERRVAAIHHGDVKAMHRRITESGRPVRANRILGVCSKMFSLSLVPLAGEDEAWRDAAMGNPCKGVARNREIAHERFYSPAELAAIADALDQYPGKTSADCVRLIMMSGCRPGESMRARWEQFSSEPGFWVRPGAQTKQRRTHKAPLAPAAIELIERRKQSADPDCPWVFPSDKRADEPIVTLWHVWEFVRTRAGLGKTARIYDLRHTYASVGAGGGLSLPIIGRLLGHTQARTTQRYAHLSDSALADAADRIGTVIAGAAAGKAGAEVMPLRGKRKHASDSK
jgi:integrase